MNFCEKKFDLDKTQFLKISFENVQICGHFGPPLASVFSWFGMSCDVDSGTRDFRLDSSHLFFLCKFNLVICTSAGKEHFVWTIDESRLKSHVPESTSQL